VVDFTRDQWLSVVRFKTAFYTFVLPCELGILVSGRTFPQTDLTSLREVCLLVGELFQAQDDMLDCFGDPAVIGKVGRDIEEGKCTWLWYTAVDALAENERLRAELIDLYSSENRADDPVIVARVKEIYKHIEIQKRFDEYLSSMAVDINSKISSIISPELRDLSVWLVESTKGRKK
jgi:farnesyl diphosphate synthase